MDSKITNANIKTKANLPEKSEQAKADNSKEAFQEEIKNLSPEQQAVLLKEQELKQDKKAAVDHLHQKIEEFGDVATKFSTFEAGMAGLGTVATGFQADWVAYFAESICEFIENSMFTEKGVPKVFRPLLKMIANLNSIKTEDGKSIEVDNIEDHKEQIIGALNRFTSALSLLNTKVQIVRNIFFKKDKEETKNDSAIAQAFNTMSKGVLPVINGFLMWVSGAGKKHIANTIQEIAPNDHDKEEVNGAMTSANQDKLCGLNSVLLMVRQGIEKFVPEIGGINLGKILEPVFALYISINSFIEGHKAVQGVDDEDPNAKYSLDGFDTSSFGHMLYNQAKSISQFFGVELPSLDKLESAKKDPKALLAG